MASGPPPERRLVRTAECCCVHKEPSSTRGPHLTSALAVATALVIHKLED